MDEFAFPNGSLYKGQMLEVLNNETKETMMIR
jgi:hypothetical protein